MTKEIEQEEQRKLQEAQDQESLGLEAARKMWKDITTTPVSRKRHKSVLELLKSSSKSSDRPIISSSPSLKARKEVSVGKNSSTKNGLILFDSMENSKHPSTTTEIQNKNNLDTSLNEGFCDNSLDIFSQDAIDEQRRIEQMLLQEREDEKLALSLIQQENDHHQKGSDETKTCQFQTPSSKKYHDSSQESPLAKFLSGNKKVNSQQSLSQNSTSSNASSSSSDSSSQKENMDSNNKINEMESPGEKKKQIKNTYNPLDLLKKKVENDLNCNIQNQNEDEALARELQLEFNKESSQVTNLSKANESTSNVFSKLKPPSQVCKQKHKSKACNKCSGCLTENCGKCVPCRDMPKFGGKGIIRQKCVYRKCIQPIKTKCHLCS